MGRKSVNMEKDGENKEDPSEGISENIESAQCNSGKSLTRRFEPEYALSLNIKQLQSKSKVRESRSWQLLFQLHGSDNKIPKHLISLDEKYLRRCLELMRVSAFRAPSSNFSSTMDVLSNNSGSRNISLESIYDCTSFGYTLAAGAEGVAIISMGDPILGSITGSKSMMNILGSPLLQKFSSTDSHTNTGGSSLLDTKLHECSAFRNPPNEFTSDSSQKLQKEMEIKDEGCEHKPFHKRLSSETSMNSTLSDQSSSAASNFICHAMLHCIWKDGFPQYIFSIDDQREVYVSHLFKCDSSDDKVLDYVYIFHSKHEIHERDSDIVGKMSVSTSISLCPNSSDIMETHFVLFGSSDICQREFQTTSNRTVKKNKALTKKVADVFRTKQRTSSKFSGTGAIFEDTSWEPSDESLNNFDPGGIKPTENDFLPNLELAAIIVKDHLSSNCKKEETGGWGLKFLKNSSIGEANTSMAKSVPSECSTRRRGECSTSMNILVPAGFHGGPRIRDGGPSSLTDRWISGGHCDCGGWDIGCPITVLKTAPRGKDVSPEADNSEVCKTFDLFVQGSKQTIPTMKMTNIHDGLHYVHFQSVLSALQAFSIAAAIIHSQSPTLRSKLYRSR